MGNQRALVIVTAVGALACAVWIASTLDTSVSVEAASAGDSGPVLETGVTPDASQPALTAPEAEGQRPPELAGIEHILDRVPEPVRTAPGNVELPMLPEACDWLRGRVVNELNEPLESFQVHAALQATHMLFLGASNHRTTSYVDVEDGSFALRDLKPATWEIQVQAEGFARSTIEVVTLGKSGDAPELLFMLVPAATAAGRVVDTSNAPVAGARVTLDLDHAAFLRASLAGGVPEVVTDARGEFRLTGLSAGAVSLTASHEGFAGSEPVACEVAPGQVSGGLLLRLHKGGTLTGIIYDDWDKPAPGMRVFATASGIGNVSQIRTSDVHGKFRFEQLEPGNWEVMAVLDFMSSNTAREAGLEEGDLLASFKRASVVIVKGEVTHAVLGAPPADPVVLHGRVVHAGSPLAGAIVNLVPQSVQGESLRERTKLGRTSADGTFEVRLQQPGVHHIIVQPPNTAGGLRFAEFLEHIPEGVADYELELVMPGGRISGRVLGPDGAPLEGCRITVSLGNGVMLGSQETWLRNEARTRANGRYDVECLRPGTYSVSAGSVLEGTVGGWEVRGDLELREGQALESVDFRFGEPGELRGTVLRPSGEPVEGATVFLRDGAGFLLESSSTLTTDASGRFNYSRLAAGLYRVSASKGELVSAGRQEVNVSSDSSSEVQVTMLPGAVLRISVEGQSGAGLQLTISVVDSAGHEVAGMLSKGSTELSPGAAHSSHDQRVGPLPDGQYTVSITHADGRSASRTVRVDGPGEQELTLSLK